MPSSANGAITFCQAAIQRSHHELRAVALDREGGHILRENVNELRPGAQCCHAWRWTKAMTTTMQHGNNLTTNGQKSYGSNGAVDCLRWQTPQAAAATRTALSWQELGYSRPVDYDSANIFRRICATWASPFLERGNKVSIILNLLAQGTNAISMHSYLQIMFTGIRRRTCTMLTPSQQHLW